MSEDDVADDNSNGFADSTSSRLTAIIRSVLMALLMLMNLMGMEPWNRHCSKSEYWRSIEMQSTNYNEHFAVVKRFIVENKVFC